MGGKKPRENEYIIRGMSSAPASRSVFSVTSVAPPLWQCWCCRRGRGVRRGLFGKIYEYRGRRVRVARRIGGIDRQRVDSGTRRAARNGSARRFGTRLDPDRIRAAYASPLTEVTRVSRFWRRHGRRFVQVRIRVADIRKLGEVAPFSWSTYELAEKDGLMVYRQTIGEIGAAAGHVAELWLERRRAGRVPAPPAEQNHLPLRARPRDQRDERHCAREHPVVGAAPDRSSGRTAPLSKCGCIVSRFCTIRCGSLPEPSPRRSPSSAPSSG